MNTQFEGDGYAQLDGVFDAHECDRLLAGLPPLASPGSRRMLALPEVEAAVRQLRSDARLATLLPQGAVAVQCTLFSKDSRTNWAVAPHQDLCIPVAERVDSPGCINWTEKEGGWFTQPPTAVLASLVAVRLQLDDAGSRSGPLRVLPGSHRFGRLDPDSVRRCTAAHPMPSCDVPRGGVLALRPLLIHASSKAAPGVTRRVLHFLFGAPELPLGLRWAQAV